ncbi:unnamed protein product [Phytophthora fragariaefolia]|uniref:Unnamed protein product n=1 Tax=Phytophthora fragariaefolia TaxID=1490495 RepID=A0A9W7DAT1_9STRA|nr:unnamed protein product [Phytophthora fragariaefolia]
MDARANIASPSATNALPTREDVTRCLHEASEQPTARSIATNMARNTDADPAKKDEGESNSDEVQGVPVPSRLSIQDATLSVASKANGGSSSARLVKREQHEQRRHQSSVRI